MKCEDCQRDTRDTYIHVSYPAGKRKERVLCKFCYESEISRETRTMRGGDIAEFLDEGDLTKE